MFTLFILSRLSTEDGPAVWIPKMTVKADSRRKAVKAFKALNWIHSEQDWKVRLDPTGKGKTHAA